MKKLTKIDYEILKIINDNKLTTKEKIEEILCEKYKNNNKLNKFVKSIIKKIKE